MEYPSRYSISSSGPFPGALPGRGDAGGTASDKKEKIEL